MFVDMSIIWQDCPGKGEIIIQNGQFIGGCVCRGTGSMTGNAFSFTGQGPCHITFAFRTVNDNQAAQQPFIRIKDLQGEFEIPIHKALQQGEVTLPNRSIKITAERNRWAEL